MKYKFELKNAFKFGWEGLSAYSYSSVNDFSGASAAVFEVTGSHGKVLSKISNRIYYILEGKGIFIIDGAEITVKKTDVIIVPHNTPYDYNGKMKLFLVHTPPWNEEAEVNLSKLKK